MNIILKNNKLDLKKLADCIAQPELFTKGTDKFWDDEYVSGQLLKFHLDPNAKEASRKRETIQAETDFIIKVTCMGKEKDVLDLGCGPGLYVREFAKTGAKVCGLDFSENSIRHANETVRPQYKNTEFVRKNYLELDYKSRFDIITLIYYDFCALNTDEQHALLFGIHSALKDGGVFVFDVISENREIPESTSITVHSSGLWSPAPYIEIRKRHCYQTPKTEGIQYTIVEENGTIRVIRIYHRLFGLEEITDMLNNHGFIAEHVYGNLQGQPLGNNSGAFGIVAKKT